MDNNENASFVNILNHLFEINNISTYKMSKDTKIPEATIGRWRNGAAYPSGKYMEIIADYFRVSLDELMGRNQTENDYEDVFVDIMSIFNKKDRLKSLTFSLHEMEIIDRLRKLNSTGCNKVLDYINDLIATGNYNK